MPSLSLGHFCIAAISAAVAHLVTKHLSKRDAERSTTSSAGGGAHAYETSKAVDEYLQMHFAAPDEVLPYARGPKGAVDFPARCALLMERYCQAVRDFTGERPPPLALDIGCAVGGATFELTKCGFGAVLGLDFSSAFINAAHRLKADGELPYRTVTEGVLTEQRVAHVPQDCDRTLARFRVADACNLPADLTPVDAVLAANLICRLPDPRSFLDRLPSLVKPGGVVVLTTPFSWLPAWTKQTAWLGGLQRGGVRVDSFQALKEAMEANGFFLKAEEDMPFLIREHSRKFQWGCAKGSVWIRNK